jgi:ArsR family transcriptional regulator
MLNHDEAIKKSQDLFENEPVCGKVLEMLGCLSNKSRLKILCLLREGEFNVGEIITVVGGKPSNISQQIKILSLAGYIKGRRQEKNIFYSLTDEKIRGILGYLQKCYTN